MRILLVSAAVFCSAALAEGAPGAAAGRTPLVARQAKECVLHLALPANWTIKEAHDHDACVVTAEEPAHASRCGDPPEDDAKVQCTPDRRITLTIRPGSIDAATKQEASDLYPFHFDDGKWRFTNAHASEHDAIPLRGTVRKVLYADYATRDHYTDGTYCCTGRNWWAMVDLPQQRIALVEVAWDFIYWDDDTTGWSDATDAQALANVERFLRTLQ